VWRTSSQPSSHLTTAKTALTHSVARVKSEKHFILESNKPVIWVKAFGIQLWFHIDSTAVRLLYGHSTTYHIKIDLCSFLSSSRRIIGRWSNVVKSIHMKTQKAFCLSVLINMSVTSKMSSLRNHKMAPFAQASSPLHSQNIGRYLISAEGNGAIRWSGN